MKITEENSGLMVVKESHIFVIFLGLVFFAGSFAITFYPNALKEPPPPWLGIFLVFMGLAFVLFTPFITISVNKASGKITFSWKRLLGEKREEYNLNEIKEIVFHAYYSANHAHKGINRHHLDYDLFFVLQNGKNITFKNESKNDKIIGEKIAQFLNVPFREELPPTPSEIFSMAKEKMQEVMSRQKR